MTCREIQLIVEDNDRVRARSEGGAEVSGRFRLSQLHRQLIAVFDAWLREKKISNRKEVQTFGALLYETLFEGEVERLFRQSLERLGADERLRLQLVFRPDAYDLAGIPWEFLYCPDSETRRGFFLATKTDVVLSRYLPLDADRASLQPAELPIRFLIVVSRPKNLAAVLAEPVVEAIAELSRDYPLKVTTLEQPTIETLLERLEDFAPHVLHFMGHGQFRAEGEIALVEADSEAALWVPDHSFAEFFDRTQPRLVVLQACEGGQIDLTNNFAGLAPRLVRAGIPAVVAMQYPVTNKTAIDFSSTFYQQLAKGEPADIAVQEARRWITLRDANAYRGRDFAAPVLYLHSRDGAILPRRKEDSLNGQ